jgi:hypothetical protein
MNRISNLLLLFNRRRHNQNPNNNDQQLIMNETTTTTTTPQPNLINLINTTPTYRHHRTIRPHKITERNYLSAFCSIFCIAVLIVSLIEVRWFYLNGGGCNINHLGVSYFFSFGRLDTHIEQSRIAKYDININDYNSNGHILHNCTNKEILIIMRLIIAFIFFAITTSFIGLIIDAFGFMRSGMKHIRRHAIFHILTVLICLIINGFCFWITERIYEQQYLTRLKKGKKIDVQFDVSYYLIVFASLLSILSTAFTLIRRYPVDDDEHISRLLNEFTGGYFDDPIDMQRSLPATTLTTTLLNVNNNSIVGFQTAQPPPPPPISQSLSINIISNPIETSINEPPPPYLLDNDNDMTPLII